ncbi:MAG TPA: carboxypeptidase regulatory-like domain-containing protein [Terriglobales bacterium]
MLRHLRATTPGATTLVLVILSCLPCAWAQYTVGRIEGTVMDATGAVLAGATVRLVNLATNATSIFVTQRDGYFVFFALPPGIYTLTAEAPRLAKRTVELAVSSDQTVTRNLALPVGETHTTIEVTASEAAATNSSDAQRDITRTEAELANLPSIARNMISTVQLGPGVSPTNNPRGGSTFGGGGSFVIVLGVQSGLIAANGGRARATSVQLDYTDANDWEAGGFAPGMQAITPDMLQELKILTSNFSAEYGVKSNAQVIMVTKSGTNYLHGTAYDFVQNDWLNARDYFDQTGKPSPNKQNIYGITAGGPIIKNRTFVFAGYEGRKTRGGSFTTLAKVPSVDARKQATDPTIIDLMNRFLPVPTGATSNDTVAVQVPSPVDNYQFVVKADHQITSSHRISARYLQGTASFVARFPSQNTLRGFDVDNHFELRNVNLSDTYVFSPKTVNELRLAYGRAVAQGAPQNGLDTPRFLISGLVNFGALQSVPASRVFNVFQINEILSHLRGRHVVRVGVDLRKIQDNSVNATNSRGVFTFASLDLFLKGQPSTWTQLFGNTSRGFRTGLYGFFVQDDWKVRPTLTLNAGLRWEVQGALSDAGANTSILDPRSTGTIGVAGAGPLGSFRLGGDAIAANPLNIAPRVGFAWNPHAGKLVIRGGYGIYWDSFTFTPLAASRSVPPFNYTITLPGARINGGNSFANLVAGTADIQAQTLAQVGGFGTLTNFGTVTTVDPHLENPYVQQFSLGIERRMPANSVVTIAYVGTKGTQLTRLVAINPLVKNRPAPATSMADEVARLALFQAAAGSENGVLANGAPNWRLDPRFDQVNLHEAGGSSIYHALQMEWKKAMSHGLQFQASYTWSKSIDNASDFSPTIQANDNSFAQNAGNPQAERAVSNFDIAHRVLVTGLWRIPFFHNFRGVSKKLFDGWSFQSVNIWQTGIPATLLAGARTLPVLDAAGRPVIDPVTHKPQTVSFADVNLDGNFIPTGADNTRPDCNPAGAGFIFGDAATIPAPNQRGVNGAPNPSNFAYTQPLLGNDGTCGRNTIRMNHLPNFDWSLFKETTLTEGGWLGSAPLTLQLRAEAYNVFNTPFLTAQSDNWRTISSSSFGLYNAAGATRRLQLAARLSW